MDNGQIVGSGTPEEMSIHAKGGGVINIVIRGPVEEIKEKLRSMKEVKDFQVKGSEGDHRTRFEVISNGEIDLSEDLFRMVAESGWTLSELHQEALSLEDVFQQLTLKEN